MSDNRYERFLFERSFDDFGQEIGENEPEEDLDPVEEEPEEPPPPPPVYTEEEMADIRRAAMEEGRIAGHEAGRQEVLEGIETRMADAMERLGREAGQLGDRQRQANERAQANLVRIVKAMLATLMPVYVKRHGADEAMAVVAECLGELQDAGRLTIKVAEENVDGLRERIEGAVRDAGFEGKFRLVADPAMGPSDAALDWGAGGAERDFEAIRERVDRAIERALAVAEAHLAECQPLDGTADDETTGGKLEDGLHDPPHDKAQDTPNDMTGNTGPDGEETSPPTKE